MMREKLSDAAADSGDLVAPPLDLLSDVDTWLADIELLPSLLPDTPPVRVESKVRDAAPAPPPSTRGRPRGPIPGQKPKNSTQRRKEELQFLRDTTAGLEARLRGLKRAAHERSQPGVRSTSNAQACVWKGIAKRQRVERATAEKENHRLLVMLRDQTRLLRSVESLLSKRQVWDPLHSSRRKTAGQTSAVDAQRYESLLQAIDTRYPMIESVFGTSSMGGSGPNRGYIKLLEAPSDGIYLETRHCTVLPFDYRVAAETLWWSIRQGKLNYFEDVTIIEEAEHQVLTSLSIVEPPVVNRPTAVYQAFKRHVVGSSTHVMWEMAVQTSGSSAYPSLRVSLQGWGRLRPAQLPDGSLGSELEEFVELSVLGPEQEANAVGPQPPRRSVSSLSGLIVSVYQQRHEVAHQTMENLLLNAGASRSVLDTI